MLVIAASQLLGCLVDPTAAPPVEVPFTLFGVVNPTADTQAVIVYPVEPGLLEPLGPEPLDAAVHSTDLSTGEERLWRDSVVSDGPGNYSHIFWSDFRAEFGRAYRLEAVRSDGARSTVVVDVPELVRVEDHDDGSRSMVVSFRGGGFRLVKVELTYRLGLAASGDAGCENVEPFFGYTFSYAGAEARREDGWDLPVDLAEYVRFMEALVMQDVGNDLLFADRDTRLALIALELRHTIGDETWDPPRGFLDRRILSHPGTLTNVENGLGFVGGGYRDSTRLFPSTDAVEEAGFYDYLAGGEACG